MSHAPQRHLGIDIGAETIKVAELVTDGAESTWRGRWIVEHNKEPVEVLTELLAEIGWDDVAGAAVTGRFSRQLQLYRVPIKQAQARGFRFLGKAEAGCVVSIGGHGFSVLELRDSGVEVFRENSRCSQGTGNFLRQLVERFDMSIEEASALCETVDKPAPLSGRCPVILKTDMTHLANKGEDRGRILAGLYDAVCENVQVLLKPRISPPDVMLVGGVTRSERIRSNFRKFLDEWQMRLLDATADEGLFLEALGSAAVAAERAQVLPKLDALFAEPEEVAFDRVPALAASLSKVKRMTAPPPSVEPGRAYRVVLGYDIGSTGSKAVALCADTREPIWEGYINTNGNPVGAAQDLTRQYLEGPAGKNRVIAFGATGSGREIVGSLLSTCYDPKHVYVLNEIAAHAEGAAHFDPRVDTIFEIGGQDAKYIRLADGRVVDAAMNEACSAGTGSFIAEQGSRFKGIEDVVQLGNEALLADGGVSLGQHCSVFMAEIIDEAVATGVENRQIIAGIYDSIIQNYLNRVKGSRDVGQVIFCQGMPFSADALAAAVVRQTGSEVVIPPNPGTVGALGIGLLTRKAIEPDLLSACDLSRFMDAKVTRKDTFICKSQVGCGGSGNYCRIDRISTVVTDKKKKFTWGGGCSLWDKGTGKAKLPDMAPNPFRQREELIERLVDRLDQKRARRTIAVTDEFMLKSLFPFFATYLFELGLDLDVVREADQGALKRGIEEANVPYCAPMQMYHGVVTGMAESDADLLFLPMLRSVPSAAGEPHSVLCPIVQGSADLLTWDLGPENRKRIVSPVIDFGVEGIHSEAFAESCRKMAEELGVQGESWKSAFDGAIRAQDAFEKRILELGREALHFCAEHGVTPVVVLGRAYTIYNKVLNSNVPAIVREQGAMAIPVDCYPVSGDVPVYENVYWGYGQRNLRAAHQVRRTPGQYSIWASNYSCGPDSFNLHFYAYLMKGRPFAIIETDGHSGDAGTKTRVEAFLHCVRQDQAGEGTEAVPNDLALIDQDRTGLRSIKERGEIVLVPPMGPGAPIFAAGLRGAGIPAEALPEPDREAVRMGRRHTSGKECIPMTVTLGSLLQRIDRDPDARFAFFMPTARGPCRFGVYNMLHKITLERLGYKDRVRVWSSSDRDYSEGFTHGLAALIIMGFCGADMLQAGLHYVRPTEKVRGAADEIYKRYSAELHQLVEDVSRSQPTLAKALVQGATGRLFGVTRLLERAAREYKAIQGSDRVPTVSMVGEIYARCDPFTNDHVISKLEERGIRSQFAPFTEWLEYTDWVKYVKGTHTGAGAWISRNMRGRAQEATYNAVGRTLGWHARTSVSDSLEASSDYIRRDLFGEAVLTVGGPVHEWREGVVDGVLSVGPLECMPTKIAEAQFFHVAEREGLPSLTLPVNGDPLDPEALDNFAYEVKSTFERRKGQHHGRSSMAGK